MAEIKDVSVSITDLSIYKKQAKLLKFLIKRMQAANKHTEVIWPDRLDMERIQIELNTGLGKAKRFFAETKKKKPKRKKKAASQCCGRCDGINDKCISDN